ncbi:facilitated trehalose transporter Tret1 [Diabrotica virgifera virgifera]|uniref:Facilitated trehalose transporter Tret1-like n=1 Tax=Diabrotica virgifera virgifera TaxID=50390 RepID=A0A6P7GCY3_DIAVI|nr:facilitated trehalose transporter Tret1 [Diabrotica virgifera virgifera]
MKPFISYALVTTLAVDLLATTGDITMTWTSPMFSKLYSNDSNVNPLPQPITKEQDALIASLINVGAMVGGIPLSYLSESYGRKTALLTIGIFHAIAYATMAFAQCVELFYFGRVIGGLAVGAGYTLLPLYIAEVAEESKRGPYSVTLGIFWALGNFLPYLIGPFLSVQIFNLVNLCVALLFFITFTLLGTETPFYLIGVNKLDDAREVLMLLRGKDSKGVEGELQHIKYSLDQERQTEPESFWKMFINPGIKKAFVISLSLIIFQQLSGWNAITFYLQPIFEMSGSNIPSDLSSLIVGASIFCFSLPAPYLTDKFGRKVLLIFSSIFLSLSLLLLAVFIFVQTRTNLNIEFMSWVPITSLTIAVFAFQNGLAVLPWTISSEVFPKNVKRLSSTSSSAACWLTSFIMTQFFNDMVRFFGVDGTMFMFAVFTFVCAVFTFLYVPETRGKTFAEIQKILQR